MKVLFIIEDTYGNHDCIGVGILSSIAKSKSWNTALVVRSGNSTPQIIERIKSFAPDVIAYSLAIGEHKNILNLHREIRKQISCRYIFGGPYPTYFPDFINEDGVDAICIGEGEIAFENYLDKVEEGKDYSNINNLVVKKGPDIIRNPLNFLIKDLDSIPFSDRQIFRQELPDLYKDSILIYTSRGCPYSCTYCCNPQFNKLYETKGSILRMRSVNNVVKEVNELGFKPPIIMFYDDNFLIKPDSWIEEFLETYGKKVGIPFTICTSADKIKDPVIKSLKKIGLRSVVYALETGDDEVNKNLLKRPVKVDLVIEAGKILKKNEIFSTLQSITLLPVADPFKLDLKTLKINQKIRPSLAVSTPLTPYPGTEIAKYSIEHGYLNPAKIDEIGKINKITTILSFRDESSMKKSLIIHYFFDLMTHYPFMASIGRYYFLLPLRFYSFLYNFYEIVFAYKRHFLFLGVKFNAGNIKRLIRQYITYRLFASKIKSGVSI